jgi:hypothetical protein
MNLNSPQPLPSSWLFLLSMSAPETALFIVQCAPCQLFIRVWSSWPLAPFVLLLHRTVRCHSGHCPVTSNFCTTLFITVHSAVDRWHVGSRCSAGSPDSPVNYSEARPLNSREWLVRCARAWCTGHCPVHQRQHSLSSFAPFMFVSPTLFLSWFVLNLMHLR